MKRRRSISGKPPSTIRKILSGILSVAVLFGPTAPLVAPDKALALPRGGVVSKGRASLAYSTSRLLVTQSTSSASFNWSSFNVKGGQSVVYKTPGSGSVSLNFIGGSGPAQIMGTVASNGILEFMDANGIVFGQGSAVSAAGVRAFGSSTPWGSPTGTVTNSGTIAVGAGGTVALVGSSVANSGTIDAPGGTIVLAAGATVTPIEGTGTSSLSVATTGGGTIDDSGVLSAETRGGRTGRIVLQSGMDSGTTTLSSTAVLDASAPNGGNGGAITVNGDKVVLDETAPLDVSAPYGSKGTIVVDPTLTEVGTASALSSIDQSQSSYLNSSVCILLTANINLADGTLPNGTSPYAWTPLGNGSSTSQHFIGTFNGNGYSVSGYTVAGNSTIGNNGTGFIGYLGTGGTVEGLELYGTVNANGYSNVGGIVGISKGTVSSSTNAGTVTGYGNVGGVAGCNSSQGIVQFSSNTGSVTGNVSTSVSSGNSNHEGGIAGDNEGTITSSNNSGAVTGSVCVGGVAGFNADKSGTIQDSYNTGSITGSYATGGVVGSSYGTVKDSYNSGGVSGGTCDSGGVAGANFGTIQDSYNTGTVTGVNNVGGVAGFNADKSGTIQDSYNTGSITGSYATGGVVGNNSVGTIQYSYNTGAVTGTNFTGGIAGWNTGALQYSYNTGSIQGSSYVGGVVGVTCNTATVNTTYDTGYVKGTRSAAIAVFNSGTVSSSYFDTTTSGLTTGIACGNSTTGSTKGLTTAQFASSSNFTSWSFEKTWNSSTWNSSSFSPTANPWYLNSSQPGSSTQVSTTTSTGNLLITAPLLVPDFPTAVVTAKSVTETYSGSPFPGGTSYQELTLGGSDLTIGTVSYTYKATTSNGPVSTSLSSVVDAGSYTITPNVSSSNVTFTNPITQTTTAFLSNQSGTLTINPAPLAFSGSVSNPTRFYDGTASATLTPSNSTATLSGFVSGQSATYKGATGTYASSNAGTSIPVSAALATPDFTSSGSAFLWRNYILPTMTLSGTGTISPAPLALSGSVSNPTKIYDGTASATLTPSNSTATLSGFASGQSATYIGAAGTYASPNAGTSIPVSATLATPDFTSSGSDFSWSNYALPTTPLSGTGTISPRQLVLSNCSVSNPTKSYDGTTTATLTPSNSTATLSGFVSGQSATYTGATGTYATSNVGTNIPVSATLSTSSFSTSGVDWGNYALPRMVMPAATGTITLYPLSSSPIVPAVQAGPAAGNFAPVVPKEFQGGPSLIFPSLGEYFAANFGSDLEGGISLNTGELTDASSQIFDIKSANPSMPEMSTDKTIYAIDSRFIIPVDSLAMNEAPIKTGGNPSTATPHGRSAPGSKPGVGKPFDTILISGSSQDPYSLQVPNFRTSVSSVFESAESP